MNRHFCHLKYLLTSKLILQSPDLNKPFTLEVDSSHFSVGEVLSQLCFDKSLHPAAYLSTSLQESQLNWSATEKDACAAVMVVRHWHVYLAGNHFTLHSDHNPVTHIRESRIPQQKVSHWLSELEEYDYTIKYIGGSFNTKQRLRLDKLEPLKVTHHHNLKTGYMQHSLYSVGDQLSRDIWYLILCKQLIN